MSLHEITLTSQCSLCDCHPTAKTAFSARHDNGVNTAESEAQLRRIQMRYLNRSITSFPYAVR